MGGDPGKLKAAARWLFSADPGGRPEDTRERAQALRELGVPADQVSAVLQARAPAAADPDALELWAWHEAVLDVLTFMRTQWQVTATPWGLHHSGLNYAALPLAERLLPVTLTRDLMQQLRTMEMEAARVLNDQSVIDA